MPRLYLILLKLRLPVCCHNDSLMVKPQIKYLNLNITRCSNITQYLNYFHMNSILKYIIFNNKYNSSLTYEIFIVPVHCNL